MKTETTGRALEGTKVLEYCSMVSGPYCTKVMADLGADVLKIEPPGAGDEARRMPPFPGDIPHPEKSGLFFYLNCNKRGITLDPSRPQGQKIFQDLVKGMDVLVEDRPVGRMEQLGLGYDALKEINPGLIMTSITPFGGSGPFKDYRGYSLNTAHVSGQAYLLPLLAPNRDRPPVKVGGHTSDYDPGLVAALAVMAALFWKGVSGRGQHIEQSKQEALISMQRVESVTYANDQVVMKRTGGKNQMPGGVLPCKDGHVVIITPEEHQWEALMELLGNPQWSKEPWCRDREARSINTPEINELLADWCMKYTREEIFKRGQALSCPVAPCQSAEDLMNSEQLAAREFFVEGRHPALGRIRFPSYPYRFSESPFRLERPAPLLGEANEEIYCGRLGYTREEVKKLKEDGVI
jgi:CoA:oxalate CoA-transferase